MKAALVIGLLLPFAAFGYDAKVFLTFEAGNQGGPIDAAYMNANDIGTPPSPWTLTSRAGLVSATNKLLFVPVTVNGSNYFGQGTRRLCFSHTSEGFFQTEFEDEPRTNSVVFACWLSDSSDMNGNFDMISLELDGGDFATLQINNGRIIAHTGRGGSSGIPIERGVPYWCVNYAKRGDGCHIWVYNEEGTLRGKVYLPFSNRSGGVRWITVGNSNAHGDYMPGEVCFDSVSLDWGANPKAPVGVPHVRHVARAGNDANAGTNLASAFATIDHAWDTATNADTRILVHPGVYSSPITPSRSGTPGDKIWMYAASETTVTNTAAFTLTGISNVCFLNLGFRGLGSGGSDRAITFDSAERIEVWHCRFTNYADFALFADSGDWMNNCIIMGNTFYGNHSYGDGHIALRGTNNLVQYNIFNKTSEDYILWSGQTNVIRNNYAFDPRPNPNSTSAAHVDFVQAGSAMSPEQNNNFTLIEANFYVDADVASDHHHFSNMSNSTDADPYSNTLLRRNIAHQIGTAIHSIFAEGIGRWASAYLVHESYLEARRHSTEVNSGSGVSIEEGGRVKNSICRDCWGSNVTSPIAWSLGQNYTNDYNQYFDSTSTVTFGPPASREQNGLFNSNPNFVSYANDDFRLQSGSPSVGSGGALTSVASASGSGTAVTVHDAGYFWADMVPLSQYNGSMVIGDTITIGTDVVTILSISGNNITFTPSITWAQNDPVYWGASTTPDRGALPFGHTPLSAAAISLAGNNYTVSPTGDARQVVYYLDGIPTMVDSTVPFRATLSGPNVTAKAFALYASKLLSVSATAGAGGMQAPGGFRILSTTNDAVSAPAP